jgi:SAM-dependent methyltransferase
MTPHTPYENLLQFFPDYDYRKPLSQFRLNVDFSRSDNIVGHQQRTFDIWWAIEQCWKTGNLGLALGFGGVSTPWCLNTDSRQGDDNYGGKVWPQLVVRGEDLSMFGDESFSLILANHVMEHFEGDLVQVLRGWHRVLKPGGVAAVVLPDQQYNDVMKMDSDHKQAWKASDFRIQVLGPLKDLFEILEFDTFKNRFSFNAVLRKKS